MKMKAWVAAATATAALLSAAAVPAYAEITNANNNDQYMIDVSAVLPEGCALSDIYGVELTFDNAPTADESNVGAVAWQSDSTSWTQKEFGQEGSEKELTISEDNAVILLQSAPLFADDDTFAQIFVMQWAWDGDTQIDFDVTDYTLLDQNGNELKKQEDEPTTPSEEYTEGVFQGLITYQKYSDHVVITGANQLIPDGFTTKNIIVLPDYIEGLPVTEIGDNAFQTQSNVEAFVIPSTCKKIGTQAFAQCDSLHGFTASEADNALEEIGDYAFGMSIENDFNFDMSIFPNLKKIGEGAFQRCTGLQRVVIPATVETIGDNAFYGTSLKYIEVDPANPAYTAVDDVLFTKDQTTLLQYHTGKMEYTYDIPNTVTTIGPHAFAKSEWLAKVTFPESVTTIQNGAFYDCAALKEVDLPASVSFIGDDAFEHLPKLTSITIRNPECVISNTYGDGSTISNTFEIVNDGNGNLTGKIGMTGTIFGYANSTAQAYATKYGYPFQALDAAPNQSPTNTNSTNNTPSVAAAKTGDQAPIAAGVALLLAGGAAFALRKKRK